VASFAFDYTRWNSRSAISERRGGAAALIGATQQGAITSSWRFIYIVMVSACLELGWALLWNVSLKAASNDLGLFANRTFVWVL